MLGDFDGDGFLDYVGIFSRVYNKYNSEYEQAGVEMDMQMQKVSMELQYALFFFNLFYISCKPN